MLAYRIVNTKSGEFEGRISLLEGGLAYLFPELEGVSLRIRMKKLRGSVAEYDHRSLRIDIDPRHFEQDANNLLPSVLAHETMHAVQHIDRRVPYGERSCDVYTLARLPDEFFPRIKDFYVKVPQKVLSRQPGLIRETANKAIQLRAMGMRNYIVWFEKELEKISRAN